MRPNENGRYVVCSWTEEHVQCHTPADFSSRTLVHEYGGGAFFVHNYRIYFSNFKDQRMYCQKLKKLDSEPIPLTPEGVDWRYADGTMYQKHIVVCVREDHDVISQGATEAQNTLVSVNRKNKKQVVLVSCLRSFVFGVVLVIVFIIIFFRAPIVASWYGSRMKVLVAISLLVCFTQVDCLY